MRVRTRLLAFVIVLLILGGAKLAQQIYRWYAFADVRAELGALERELEIAAAGVILTKLEADSLRGAIDRVDADLGRRRRDLAGSDLQVVSGGISRPAAGSYPLDRAGYDQRVADRNQLFQRWRVVIDHNLDYVSRYNTLVESILDAAHRMGEPYYPIRSPAEIATGAGIGGLQP